LSVSQEFDPGDTYVLNTLLQEAFRDGTGASVYRRLAGRPALAGKSGTTDDLRDSWYAGFGKDRLAVVWLGRDDNTPAGLTGSAGALQVWGDLMETLAPDGWLVQKPDDVEWRWADDARGVLTDQGCANSVKYPFLDGTEPDYESCSLF
jgi:penicillin-binding protein 1B